MFDADELVTRLRHDLQATPGLELVETALEASARLEQPDWGQLGHLSSAHLLLGHLDDGTLVAVGVQVVPPALRLES
jgi:hypothetical protein